ncbi:quinolinate synthase [Fistulifera solaris]|uniref:quinolinate synthase n=1 Tax=Fistulifera solaris TaxID=1519565 RepID=A0A1Z5KU02_FISSO|nr:quinolinate synthase [Fistulifera solaris]|eukprot:GAX29625.1 quinolinate synthase [Fistulifera solaris]
MHRTLLSKLSRTPTLPFRCFASVTTAFEQSVDQFPSLIIGRSIQPVGSFAEAQALYLDPDPVAVKELAELLEKAKLGVVAHYYMDVELQGVLQAVQKSHPAIGIADSLKMGDMAVEMMQSGRVEQIACLGVDFMSESVQSILHKNGFEHVPVYRATANKIGCSLAESAERAVYRAWLEKESAAANSLHVVYINTSLETKAISSSLVPTITCTSSNVLATILQAYAQVPDIKILYGPDTYMGENLVTLLTALLQDPAWNDQKIAKDLHPNHNRETLRGLRDSIAVFPSGNCIVHHMFGDAVVETVRSKYYDDCFITAHLEVPGEMFQMAMEKSLSDEGVVGSTSDILKFVSRKVKDASRKLDPKRLKFILGTEAGMITSIVQSVQNILADAPNPNIEAEIIFPVASAAMTGTGDMDMPLVPGVSGGEGCSTSGGCATCPFMKMNSLDSLMQVAEMVLQAPASSSVQSQLQQHLPPVRLQGKSIQGRPAIDWGTESILYMRSFMQDNRLPDELVRKIMRN